MRYWSSSEADVSVIDQVVDTDERLREAVEFELASGALVEIDIEFCHIPIVMSPEFRDLYPARTLYSKSDRKFYHSPVLDYEIFISGSAEQKATEFLSGMLGAEDKLARTGMNKAQRQAFADALTLLLPDQQT